MQIRNLAASTIDSYTWHVDKFCSHFGKRPKKLPVVLSDQEASRLIECTENPKHRTVLLTCYAAGLRLAEATHLKVATSTASGLRSALLPEKGAKKGTKRRPAVRCPPASPRLLDTCRELLDLKAADQKTQAPPQKRAEEGSQEQSQEVAVADNSPRCQQPMVLLERILGPSWRDVFHGSVTHPPLADFPWLRPNPPTRQHPFEPDG